MGKSLGKLIIIYITCSLIGWCHFHATPYRRERMGPACIRVMACRLVGDKPLLEPMLTVNWTTRHIVQWNLNQNTNFSFNKVHLKVPSTKWWRFSSVPIELSPSRRFKSWAIHLWFCLCDKLVRTSKFTLTSEIDAIPNVTRFLSLTWRKASVTDALRHVPDRPLEGPTHFAIWMIYFE